MTQTDRILNHMRNYGPITGRVAHDMYGIERLGARVWELKKAGFDIRSEMVEGVNRWGEKVHFKKYWLRKEVS